MPTRFQFRRRIPAYRAAYPPKLAAAPTNAAQIIDAPHETPTRLPLHIQLQQRLFGDFFPTTLKFRAVRVSSSAFGHQDLTG